MNFKEGICPRCQGILHIPEDRDKIICMYCGEQIMVSDIFSDTKITATAVNNIERPADYDINLQMGMNNLPKLLMEIESPLVAFKKDKYEQYFKSLYHTYEDTLEAISKVYRYTNDKEEVIRSLALNFADGAAKNIDSLTKKGAKEQKLMDYNLSIAVYVVPIILEYNNKSLEILADRILEEWKIKFPKTNVGKSDFEHINGGFRKKLCYISTAVCETLGKSDDCYELTLLRNYRDDFLMNQPGGEEIVNEYYDIAPTIVKRINKLSNSRDIYKSVWDNYLNPCVQLIEEDKNNDCKVVYYKMVRDLQQEYCH
ncbi:MAG: CFI-box-CTERM domain-containing protein [Lachnotalea sp.]